MSAPVIGDHGIFTLDEFYNRGVIKLAPDVLVYIGGSLQTTVIAPVSSSNSKLSFNDGITNVSIQNNVDPPGSSSANIEIVTPIYGPNSNYWTNYKTSNGQYARAPVFVPMLEVKIYLKGRFLVDMKPRYYPAFWGFITQVDENYTGDLYKFTLNCVDMLHWWAYSSLNVHPVPESNIYAGGAQSLTVYSTIFERSNPYNILYKLNSNMGMHEFVTPSWVAQMTSINENYPQDLFKKATSGIMQYWSNRFAGMANLLKMYGINGKSVNVNGILGKEPDNAPIRDTSGKSNIKKGAARKDTATYSPDISFLEHFEIFADYDKMGTFENAEYTTKLEIATEIKTRCNFEFYQDTNGNFIFKPPFYNLNVKGLVPYTLLPSDIISYSVNTDTEGIITVMNITTPQDKNLRTTPWALGQGFHMDIDLTKRYGVRFRNSMLEYVNDPRMARTMALGQMSQINAKTLTGNVTIPGRPEVRLGYPIYMEHRDSFHYVKSINHSFDYGGSFTTTLSLETERQQAVVSEVLDKKIADNKDLIYILSTEPKSNDPKKAVSKAATSSTQKVNSQDPPRIDQKDPQQEMQDILLKGKVIGGEEGLYTVQKRTSVQQMTTTITSIPLTDADGYKLIGSFPYGRNLNPVVIASELVEPPVYKDVYLTTMARPVYKSESAAMDTLFFTDKEGAVSTYLSDSLLNSSNLTLNEFKDVLVDGIKPTETMTPDQLAASGQPVWNSNSVTNMGVPGANNQPPAYSILVNQVGK